MANLNLNKVILGGRLTAAPELKQTPSGVAVLSFTVAVNRRYAGEGAEAQTDFISCTAWRKSAEFIAKYFRKGSSICVVGAIQVRSWQTDQGEKRYATEVIVDEANFVDSKGDTTSQGVTVSGISSTAPQFEAVTDDEGLPF